MFSGEEVDFFFIRKLTLIFVLCLNTPQNFVFFQEAIKKKKKKRLKARYWSIHFGSDQFGHCYFQLQSFWSLSLTH